MSRRSLTVLASCFSPGQPSRWAGSSCSGAITRAPGGPNPGGGYGPGMMGGYGGAVQSSVTPAELAAVRDRVEQRLADAGYRGFAVGEIMAFSNNDYVLVKDAKGTPAFELLAAADGRWLMPEPQSMMWNTSYGMMRGLSIPACPYDQHRRDA